MRGRLKEILSPHASKTRPRSHELLLFCADAVGRFARCNRFAPQHRKIFSCCPKKDLDPPGVKRNWHLGSPTATTQRPITLLYGFGSGRTMNLAEWLVRTARRLQNAPALLRGKNLIADYAQCARRVAILASALQTRLGIGSGDRVAIVPSICIENLELLYAAWFAGAAVVPINFKLHAKEAAWIIENAEAKAVFVSDSIASELIPLIETLPGVAAAIVIERKEFAALRTSEPIWTPAARTRDDLAWLFYTSGTTGKPKGVMISNGNMHAMAFSYFVDVDEVRTTDASLYAAPMSHGAGLYNFMHVMRGARHVVPESGGFEADEVLALARSLRDISMFAAPTMVRRLIDRAKSEASSGDGIRTIVYGGGPMYLADIEDAVATMGPRFV